MREHRMMSYPFLSELPWKPTITSICLPTLHLWFADSRAMGTGTWRIEEGTKLNFRIGGLELESVRPTGALLDVGSNSSREALFFLVSNMMVVLGLVGCDYAYALQEYESLSQPASDVYITLRKALSLLARPLPIDASLISALSQAVYRLQEKSQSMFLGSALFQGQLRIDLIFLYYPLVQTCFIVLTCIGTLSAASWMISLTKPRMNRRPDFGLQSAGIS